MRDEKEERKKQAWSNKQTRQSNTTIYTRHMYIIIVYRLLYIHAYYVMCVYNDVHVHVHVLCLGCHGTVDYNRYPSESVQKKWITHYLEECARLKGIYIDIIIYITVHVLMRDEKEERKARSNKQTRQSM